VGAPHVLDVGSGAGFPGLALAIAFPAWRVTLLEATGKKVRFLETVLAELSLTNAQALTGRAEDIARRPEHRGAYGVVTARAVAAMPTLLEYCAPFARAGGQLIMPKKGDLTAELAAGGRAAPLLGACLLDSLPVTVPPLDDGRVLVMARQERPCPPQYPRAAGAPVKRPLGA
jgi:16S rRNA (guanine527-N7)-methyltransferase